MGDVIYLSGAASKGGNESEDLLRSIRPVVVYFLHYGRNAWHSTWIKRYQPNHFFRDIRSVKALVDSRKWQGTVLYLDVLPAIQLEFTASRFVLTEINTDNPFKNFQRSFPLGFDKSLSREEFLSEIGKAGTFWKEGQRFQNSVILQEVETDFLDFWSAQLVGSPAQAYCGTFSPLKVGYYRRDVEPDFWSWSRVLGRAEATEPKLTGFRAAVKSLIMSAERGPFAKPRSN